MSLYKSYDAAAIGITAAFVFLVVTDLFGNSLVCMVVFRKREMRTPMNLLLVNLAVADMMVAVFIAIRYIFPLGFTHPKGKAGDIVCQLLTGETFMWVGASASAFSLVSIALERYLAIKFPYERHKRITMTKLKGLLVVLWVLAVTWNVPLFLYARYNPVSEFCLFRWPTENFTQFHSLACAMVFGGFTMGTMIYLYSRLVYMLWFRSIPTESTLAQQRKLMYCKKTARLVVTVSAIYCVCWIPMFVTYALSSYTSLRLYSSVHTTTIVLVTLNSAINPVLYSLQSERFRKHILSLLPFSGCSRNSCRIFQSNLVTSTDESNKTGSIGMQTLPFESRGPTG